MVGPPPTLPPATPVNPAAPLSPGPRLAGLAADATQLADEVLVTQAAGEPDSTIDGVALRLGLTVFERVTVALIGARIVRLGIPDGRSVDQILQALSAEPGIGPAQPNYVYRRQQGSQPSPAVPQYALQKIAVDGAPAVSTGRNVVVAIVDTGVDGSHPDMRRSSLASHDVLGESVAVDLAHGTAIAGIIGARGVTRGIAPDARLLSLRAFASFASPASGGPSLSTSLVVLKALEEAMGRKARVLNLSFAGPRDRLVETAIGVVIERRAVVVAAAGNGGDEAGPAFPAAYRDVIAVTATDSDDRLYSRANRGDYIAVAAPGVDVLAASAGHGHELVSGTSFATAHVSGLAALLLQLAPELTPVEVRQALQETAKDLGAPGHDPAFGAGLANASVLSHASISAKRR